MPNPEVKLYSKEQIEIMLKLYPEYVVIVYPDGKEGLIDKQYCYIGRNFYSWYWDNKKVEIAEMNEDKSKAWLEESKHA